MRPEARSALGAGSRRRSGKSQGPPASSPATGVPLSSVLGGWAFVLSFSALLTYLGEPAVHSEPAHPPSGHAHLPCRLSPAQATGKYARHRRMPPPRLTPVTALPPALCTALPQSAGVSPTEQHGQGLLGGTAPTH